MGLDTSHDAWHGPYSSFNRFRFWLAEQIGINLHEYKGYGNFVDSLYHETGTKELSTIDHDIMPLLNHSDCDGILTPEECRKVARGLTKIIAIAKEDLKPFSNYQNAINFRRGCIKTANANQNLEFH